MTFVMPLVNHFQKKHITSIATCHDICHIDRRTDVASQHRTPLRNQIDSSHLHKPDCEPGTAGGFFRAFFRRGFGTNAVSSLPRTAPQQSIGWPEAVEKESNNWKSLWRVPRVCQILTA
jgi:hypothetical protein